MTIAEKVFAIATSHPDWCAAIHRGRRVSYPEFAHDVRRLAAWLDRAGLGPRDSVGVALRDEYDHLVAALALLHLGCCQVTVASTMPAAAQAETLRRCGAHAVVAEDAWRGPPGVERIVPDFAKIFADPAGPDRPTPGIDLDAAAFLFPSSGTTGRPKIVPVTQRQYLAGSWNRGMGAPQEVVFRPTAIEFDAAKRQHVNAAFRGIATLLCDPGVLRRPGAACETYRVRNIFLSPAQARGLIDGAPDRCAHVVPAGVRVQIGGSPVSGQLRRDARRSLAEESWVTYGATECGTLSNGRFDGDGLSGRCLGRPLAGVDVEIVDDEDRPLPAGRVGRLRVRTAGMISGYFDDPEATATAFRGGWFYSGDLGCLTADGALYFEGRGDDMMCLSGVNVFPLEIEAVIESFPGVVECAAFPLPSTVHGDIPVAAVTLAADIDIAALYRYCRSRLGIRAPRKIFPVPSLPRNDGGKVVRRALAELVARGNDEVQDGAEAQRDKERGS